MGNIIDFINYLNAQIDNNVISPKVAENYIDEFKTGRSLDSIKKEVESKVNSVEKFIHLPKPGYILDGMGGQIQRINNNPCEVHTCLDFHKYSEAYESLYSWGPGTFKIYDTPEKVLIDFETLDDCINNLAFVHGDKTALLNGKVCVIRNLICKITDDGLGRHNDIPVKKAVLHFFKGVIIFLDITSKGNAKIVFKPAKQ